MGIVALRGVEVFGYIGVLEAERRVGRKFLIDIEVKASLKKASESDSEEDILNYAIISDIIHGEMEAEFKLLEAAARAIGMAVFKEYPAIEAMKIRIYKMNPFMQGNIQSAFIEWDYPEDFSHQA